MLLDMNTAVDLHDPHEKAPQRMTLGEFLEANDELFPFIEVVSALATNGEFRIGGGAAPEFTVRLVTRRKRQPSARRSPSSDYPYSVSARVARFDAAWKA